MPDQLVYDQFLPYDFLHGHCGTDGGSNFNYHADRQGVGRAERSHDGHAVRQNQNQVGEIQALPDVYAAVSGNF